MPNRLANEKSPYLQQHANNPVDWYPWGPEAIARAKAENKPIFLSIGYSTCHWCHVMAHESFEDPAAAAVMNELFINVKVDREERPDLDHVYMTSVQMMTGSGGWPMSVWMTPDLQPFFSGTYFPPDNRYGRPAFVEVLKELGRLWKEEPARVLASSSEITGILQQALGSKTRSDFPASAGDLVQLKSKTFRLLEKNYDAVHGGFGRAPKFPLPGTLSFLLYYYLTEKDSNALNMVASTWKNMVAGGLWDQLGGGFARYSTDERWLVPHFEKMLYDNTQLAMVGTQLFQVTQEMSFKEQAEDTLRYLERDLRHPAGGFYSAEDADSEGKEGTFYLWTLSELKSVLPPDLFDEAVSYFGVTPNGNFMDPHTGELGQNILTQKHQKSADPSQSDRISKIKSILFQHRAKRVRPHRDEKIITEWNGLAISAFARAGRAFQNENWTQLAIQAAEFICANLWDEKAGELYRRWRDGEKKYLAFQTDYSFLAAGLLDLFESTGDPAWLEWADVLHRRTNELFQDSETGGYYQSRGSLDLLIRYKEAHDGVIPSGNSVAVLNGLRLGRILNTPAVVATAQAAIQSMGLALAQEPSGMLQFLLAADVGSRPPAELVYAGLDNQSGDDPLFAVFCRVSDPNVALVQIRPGPFLNRLAKIIPAAGAMKSVSGQPAAYLCANFTCQAPISDPEKLARSLSLR